MDQSDNNGAEIKNINHRAKKYLLFFIILLALVIFLFVYVYVINAKHHFKIIFFNVGQGDSALITFSDGQKMLVDCGQNRKVLSKLGKYLPFYDRTIDYLLISHFDLDHYGGCADVLKKYKVKKIITNGIDKPNDPYWQVWNESVRQENVAIKIITHAEVWHIGAATLNFLSPDIVLGNFDGAQSSNNQSVIFKLMVTGTSALFAGDMETPLENALMITYCATATPATVCSDLHANWLKVAHHGSDSSSGANFLRAVGAKNDMVSVGKNTFGHPSLRVLKRLERSGAAIWRTDVIGDIIVE